MRYVTVVAQVGVMSGCFHSHLQVVVSLETECTDRYMGWFENIARLHTFLTVNGSPTRFEGYLAQGVPNASHTTGNMDCKPLTRDFEFTQAQYRAVEETSCMTRYSYVPAQVSLPHGTFTLQGPQLHCNCDLNIIPLDSTVPSHGN